MKAIIFTGYEHSKGLERVNGAYRIATVLREEGWDVEVVDFFYHWSLEQLEELIDDRSKRGNIDWIGFSITWLTYAKENTQLKMLDFLTYVKTNYPDIITIAGGQNPSLYFPMYEKINYVIDGFGEIAIKKLLKFIYGNETSIERTLLKNGAWYINANKHYKAWPMTDMAVNYEKRDFISQGETLSIEISRGCKFACAFCNFPILGVKEDTTRDISKLEYELQRNYDLYGVTNYQIADETLNDRDEKLAKMSKIVKNLNFTPNFNAFIRGDILFSKPQQLELLTEARVWGHYYGIETFNHETGKIVGKGMHPDKIKQGLLDTKDYFYKNNSNGWYRGTISLVYGLPKESIESIVEAQDWLVKNWSDQNTISFPYNINLTGKKSKIDEAPDKYGYNIIGQEKMNLHTVVNFLINDITIWENELMNAYDAIKLSKLQNETLKYVDCWSLWSLFSVADSIEDAVRIRYDDIGRKKTKLLKEKTNIVKDEYIQKKLSL